MDQAVLAGVGNVYRAEILFRQRVDPFLPGRGLGAERFQAVWDDLSALMRAGVRRNRIVSTCPSTANAAGGYGPRTRTTSTAAPDFPAASAAPRCVPR